MKRDLWVENLFRPLVIGLMAGCMAWSLGQLVLIFAPAWDPTYLVVGCVLAAWEACYSYRLLRSPRMLGHNVLRFRLVELSLIFLLLKLGRYAGRSIADVLAEIQGWPHDLSLVFDGQTIAAFVLTLLCWGAATQTLWDLDRIGTRPESRGDQVSPVERLTARFFGGGVVLLIASGLARIGNTSELLNLNRSPARGIMLNVVIYFFLGVVMLGQVRFVELRREWRARGAQVADQVADRWVRYSLSLIGLASLVAAVLPTQFTLGALSWIANSLNVVGAVVFYVVSLLAAILFFPVGLLLWLLLALLSRGEGQPAPQPRLPTLEPLGAPGGDGAMNWWEVARVLIFWAVALAGVSFVVRSYLRDRPELRETIRTLKPLQALRWAWVSLWRWLRGRIARLGQTVSERLPRRSRHWSPPMGALGWPLRFFRLGALSPRERVLYYYLSILRRAGRQGYPRRRHQTPREYQTRLASELPQAQEDLASLTQAFVEARYSQHEVGRDQDQEVRTYWERVKAALRALKRWREPGEEEQLEQGEVWHGS